MSDRKPKSKVPGAAWTPLLLATTMLTGVAAPAMAQDNSATSAAPATTPNTSSNDEIIVTATKRSENIGGLNGSRQHTR